MGSALSNLRQRPLADVAASRVQRFVVREAFYETVDLCPRTSQSAACIRVPHDCFGSRCTGHCGAFRRRPFLIMMTSEQGT